MRKAHPMKTMRSSAPGLPWRRQSWRLAACLTLALFFTALCAAPRAFAQTQQLDFGDAPQSYPVTLTQDGARHSVDFRLFLGRLVDIESNGQPSINASGDDALTSPNSPDDEDGVAFTSSLIPGQSATVEVQVSVGQTRLDLWADCNRDGDWDDPGEKLVNAQFMNPGLNVLTINIPSTAIPGPSFSRVRLSYEGAPAPRGLAFGGEVEDHPITIAQPEIELDFGDAPENYPVMLGQDGARHRIVKGVNLGEMIDPEKDGQPSGAATGDDNNPAGVPPDEDGVVFITPVKAGARVDVEVLANVSGLIDAWIDFNQNGSWADPGEKIFNSEPVPGGFTVLSFIAPASAVAGETFARFRFSLKGGLLPTGLAADGEVEDYLVKVEPGDVALDFGDTPDTFPVVLAQDGARHAPDFRLFMGKTVDTERDGQISAAANGDDAVPAGAADDEDGVTFSGLLNPGQSATVHVEVSVGQTRLDAWVDFNRNGSWDDAGEKIFNGQLVNAGVNTLTFPVPASSIPGGSFSRFRISYQGAPTPRGLAQGGEVEDHPIGINEAVELDFGDAPQNYPVMLGQDGARHRLLRGFQLGSLADPERDGQPSSGANGDDVNPPTADDEDGVVFTSALLVGQPASVQVTASSSGLLDAWIDFNKNGNWNDPGEKIFTSRALVAGANNLTFTVPASALEADTFSRWRFSRQGGLLPTGPGGDGEVEDHPVTIRPGMLDFGDAPQIYPVMLGQDGARHIFRERFYLGAGVDLERDGQPSTFANGDDNNPTAADDEDGVRFLGPVLAGSTAQVEVVAGSPDGFLDAWMDFNHDGDWADEGEKIFHQRLLTLGINNLSFTVPEGAAIGETFSRWRFSARGALSFTGLANEGEVEDHPVRISERLDPCTPRTHRGTNFWLTFPGNYAPDPDNPVRISLGIVGPRETKGRVTIPGLGFVQDFIIDGTLHVVIPLPRAAELADAVDIIEKKGIHVTAEREVAVYGLNRVKFTSDGYLGLPSDVVGTAYMIQSYKNNFTGVPPLNGSQFALVGNHDNTRVRIVPKVATAGHPAGVPYIIILNQGETYQLRSTDDLPSDLTSSLVVSDKPISVFGSHQVTTMPSSNYWFADHLVEQLIPVQKAGTFFPFISLRNKAGDTFRVMAIQDTTSVQVNGVVVATLNSGQVHQQIIAGPGRIQTDKPVLVSQFANSADYDNVENSDPFMISLQHTGQFLNAYEVWVPDSGFSPNFLNIVAPNSVVGTLTVNGAAIAAASYVAIPGTTYSAARVSVGTGVQRVLASAAFGLSVYGWAQYDSYGYPGGSFFGDTEAPRLFCPEEDIVVTLSTTGTTAPPCVAPVPDLRDKVQVVDNCGLPQRIVITQTPAPGTMVGPGVHVITLSTTDLAGNTGYCFVNFIVRDPSPLQIFCPQDITVPCNTDGGAIVKFDVVARKRCAEYEVKATPASGSFFPEGTTIVNAKAIDEDGNEVNCSFRVTVSCGEKPKVAITISGGKVVVSWTNAQVLESAPSVLGPWTAVQNAASPYTVNTSVSSSSFFRVVSR